MREVEMLNIKCRCGYDEKLPEKVADNLNWNEDETVDCPDCGSKIKYDGFNKPQVGKAVYID